MIKKNISKKNICVNIEFYRKYTNTPNNDKKVNYFEKQIFNQNFIQNYFSINLTLFLYTNFILFNEIYKKIKNSNIKKLGGFFDKISYVF